MRPSFSEHADGEAIVVRLGKSGLKVSRIILGMMTYGSSEWQAWIKDEKLGIEHVKAAYVDYLLLLVNSLMMLKLRCGNPDLRHSECMIDLHLLVERYRYR